MGEPEKLEKIGSLITTLGTVRFYFQFGDREYSVTLNIGPRATPLIILHKHLDSIGLNDLTYHKTRPEPYNGYNEDV